MLHTFKRFFLFTRLRNASPKYGLPALLAGVILLLLFHSGFGKGHVAQAPAQPASTSPAPNVPVSDDPAALQKRFQKVILDSLARQRIPYRDFAWLAPKAVDNDILALPFSIIVGAQKIVLPVYIINHRYLVTTPLLDITRHYAVVPSIPPPPASLPLSPLLHISAGEISLHGSRECPPFPDHVRGRPMYHLSPLEP